LDPTLLLDEPTEGIQPNIVHEIGDIIQRVNREINLTVLLVEQKLPFARRVATDLRILDKGRLVMSGEIDALTDEVVHAHLTVKRSRYDSKPSSLALRKSWIAVSASSFCLIADW
jgi:urea transport system ATP-binding protein